MKVVFMGTPEFAIPSLQMLVREGYEVCAVLTQPDKQRGRGNRICYTPIKDFALTMGIEILQPESVRTDEIISKLMSYKPDFFVTAAFGKILPAQVLNIPKYGCINVHASLLPRLRGAGPIQWSIINGDSHTGITTMFTELGLDTGDMLLKEEVAIDDGITSGELHDKLSIVGARVLSKTIKGIIDGSVIRVPQNHSEATYAPIIKKELGRVDFHKTACEIHNLIRGVNPWPGAFTTFKGQRMRIWKACPIEIADKAHLPGTILEVARTGMIVKAYDNAIKILEVQFDSCNRMCVGDYLCGNKITEGEILGKED